MLCVVCTLRTKVEVRRTGVSLYTNTTCHRVYIASICYQLSAYYMLVRVLSEL